MFFGSPRSSAGVVTLSGETITRIATPTAIAGLRINADGTVDKLEGVTYTQIDASTDWIIPNSAGALAAYTVTVSVTGDTLASGTTGTPVAISTSPEWTLSATGVDKASTLTVTIKLGTATLASNTYILEAEASGV